MVASKYLYDEGEDEEVFNDDWAKAGKKYLNFFVWKTMYFASETLHSFFEVHIKVCDQCFSSVFRKQNCEWCEQIRNGILGIHCKNYLITYKIMLNERKQCRYM